MSIRVRSRWGLATLLPVAAVVLAMAGCSGGLAKSEPKKYEGGGPLPEFSGEELPPETPNG